METASSTSNKPSTLLVIIAFVIVYIVWGSTYFFIQMAVQGFPPMLMGAMRFFTAGVLLLAWCYFKGDKLWVMKDIITSGISGLLMLFVATGIVIWTERTLPSAMVAIMVSANPIWFVLLDKVNWKTNFKSRTTIAGLILGFAGVILLFGEAISKSLAGAISYAQLNGLLLLLAGPIAWSVGSLYSKKRGSDAPARVNTSWQMIIAGLAFIPAGLFNHEFQSFHFAQVPAQSWFAIAYLILFGSIAAFSAYVWLLKVRPATEVSTHSYVNPVIAVLLGTLFANENISGLQILGLFIILVSVLLVNMVKYGKFTLILSHLGKVLRNSKLKRYLSTAQNTGMCVNQS
ncbi:EamA family transporter [Mucilaginibacter pocheonensis]|uniref:Drug/metabolite transporter (DMT)-like permease n=1 Tax=Mucilaginibacter pocheonensis TaxID=398050 RepID=A0ABU1TA90_9SPHI|nr:EamA family transporter [Mucilaginibacter pocheonensis]MDR6942161.1 drug/metabolite transporter (DMT)-like permease [Mucilaginibacter pocheonensis]